MKRFCFVLFSTVLLLASAAIAQPPTMSQFSADMTSKSAKGDTATGKFYMGDRKTRMDMTSHGMEVRMLFDLKAKKSYMLMVAQHMYMEHNIDEQPKGNMAGPSVPSFKPECDPDHFTCKSVGTEMVNGRLCDKWVYTAKDAGNEAANQTTWVDMKIRVPVRVIHGDGSQMDFTNIKEGPQEASLFELPAGYQPFNPMGMMGGRKPH